MVGRTQKRGLKITRKFENWPTRTAWMIEARVIQSPNGGEGESNHNTVVIALHFPRKRGKLANLRKVTPDAPTPFPFHFALASFSPPAIFSPPSLSPSSVCCTPELFSSDKRSLSCIPKQARRAAICLSHLIGVFTFRPGRGDGAPESWRCRFPAMK